MKDYASLPLRIVLGIVFLVHGYLKLTDIQGTANFFSSIGIPLANLFAYFVALLELFGGIMLILGLIVKLTSVLLIITMVVAMLLVHLPKGFLISKGGYEYVLTILAGLITLTILGAGKFSLQKVFKK